MKERNRILSRKIEEGVSIEVEKEEYKNKLSELVAKAKRKIIGEDVYRVGPKYVSRGTDTTQDSKRESIFVQGLKFFPRRLSRAAHSDMFGGGEGRRRSLFSGPDSIPTTADARQRRRSTHVRKKSMAEAAVAYALGGRQSDSEKISGFYQRKQSMASGSRRKSIKGEEHRNKRKSVTGTGNGENNKDIHHRRRSSVHHRRKSIDHRRKSTRGDDVSGVAEKEGEHHRQHRRKSTVVDREERSPHHRRKSTVLDGEERSSHHRKKSTVLDGKERSPHHRRKSTVLDGEERSPHHRRKSTVLDGEERSPHHRRKSTVLDGEERSPHHKRKSTVLDGEERSPHHRRKSTVLDSNVKDDVTKEGEGHHHRRSEQQRRKSTVAGADLKDASEEDVERHHHRRSLHDRKKSTTVDDVDGKSPYDMEKPNEGDADAAEKDGGEYQSKVSSYDSKRSTLVDSEVKDTDQIDEQYLKKSVLKVAKTYQEESEEQIMHQVGAHHDIHIPGILKTTPQADVYDTYKKEPSVTEKRSREFTVPKLSLSTSDTEISTSHASKHQ